jgi:hypothetical protein
MYMDYVNTLGTLFKHDPSLKWIFGNSIFPVTTINFGPNSVCFDHLDKGNRAVGWCDIASLGDYDPKKGGHLILFDIDKIIEFPPGSHILIPSAVMRHGNTPIQKGEKRLGFTQYSAGGLFRWVDNGFRRSEDVEKADPALKKRLDDDAPTRYEKLLNLYSKLDELSADYAMIFGTDA